MYRAIPRPGGLPARPGHHGARLGRVAREVVLMLGAVLVYFAVRSLTEGSAEQALTNARSVVRLERFLGIFWEPQLQALIDGEQHLVTLANWVYIWGHWPVIALVGGWLLFERPATYRVVRTAFLISGAIGMVIFATFPVAPPRLADLGFMDTVALHSNSYRVLQPPALTNQYAAVPSLHFGWNLLAGIVLVQRARGPLVRMFGLLMPVLMLAAIVLTANHYILDAAAGAAVALLGLWSAQRLFARGVEPAEETRNQNSAPVVLGE
jgi:hypothetical protein